MPGRTPGFQDALKRQIELCVGQLSSQNGLSTGSHVTDAPITVLINSVVGLEGVIRVHDGIYYRSVIAGCSYADDTTPASENNEYGEVLIDKETAFASVALVRK